jgi:hypothetical protein
MLQFGCLQERRLYHVGEGLREPVEIRLVLSRALWTLAASYVSKHGQRCMENIVKVRLPFAQWNTKSATGKGLAARLTRWQNSMRWGCSWRRPHGWYAASGAPPHGAYGACGCLPMALMDAILVVSLPSKTPSKHRWEQETELIGSTSAKKATRKKDIHSY